MISVNGKNWNGNVQIWISIIDRIFTDYFKIDWCVTQYIIVKKFQTSRFHEKKNETNNESVLFAVINCFLCLNEKQQIKPLFTFVMYFVMDSNRETNRRQAI